MNQNKKQISIALGLISAFFMLGGIIVLWTIHIWIGIIILTCSLIILVGQIIYIGFKKNKKVKHDSK